MGKKLYCGNLSFNVTSSDLDQLFAQFGTVQSAEVINDRDTGRSKGFGFVEMGTDAEAQAAIAGINGTEHDGRTLTVNEARPREDRTAAVAAVADAAAMAAAAAVVAAAATVAAAVVAAAVAAAINLTDGYVGYNRPEPIGIRALPCVSRGSAFFCAGVACVAVRIGIGDSHTK